MEEVSTLQDRQHLGRFLSNYLSLAVVVVVRRGMAASFAASGDAASLLASDQEPEFEVLLPVGH